MTRKELQKWLDQFPPDAEIWKNSDGTYYPIDIDCTELSYSKEAMVWESDNKNLLNHSDTIERSKVKRIIF